MSTKGRRSAKVTARMERVWKLHVRGWSEWRIAAKEGIDQSQVSRDLSRMQARKDRRSEESQARMEAEKQLAIAMYNEVKAEAFEEWERSKSNRERTREKVRVQPGKLKPFKPDEKPAATAATAVPESLEIREAEQATEGRLGDPQYLQAAIRAQQQIDSLNGLVKQTISIDLAERVHKVIQRLQADGHDI